ncbi:MAG: GtrA family protein [Xanthomonadales bacterium]|nr:GtrA family protein [Xanthomonadales bacterium]
MNTLRQGARFFAVGSALVCVDWLVFVVLSALGVAPMLANVSGRVAGALFGFVLNGVITFGRFDAPRLGLHRLGRFVVLWVALTTLSTVLVTSLADHLSLHAAWIAKPAVEAMMATLSFFISRHWVYR